MAAAFHQRVKELYEAHQSEGWYYSLTEDTLSLGPVSNRKACVLLCIRQDSQGVIHVLLTVRSQTVSTHKGEVCLPGGMHDKSDCSLLATALREGEEEINIKPHQVQFVGFLQNLFAWSSQRQEYNICYCALVTLVVDDISELNLTPNEAEVSDIFWMPLKIFLGGGPCHSQRSLPSPCPTPFHYIHMNFFTHQLPNGKLYRVWGMTAMFCVFAAVILYQSPPHFPCTVLSMCDHSTSSQYKQLSILRINCHNNLILKSKI